MYLIFYIMLSASILNTIPSEHLSSDYIQALEKHGCPRAKGNLNLDVRRAGWQLERGRYKAELLSVLLKHA